MSVFQVILVRIFPHSDQNNSEDGHFSRSAYLSDFYNIYFVYYFHPYMVYFDIFWYNKKGKPGWEEEKITQVYQSLQRFKTDFIVVWP